MTRNRYLDLLTGIRRRLPFAAVTLLFLLLFPGATEATPETAGNAATAWLESNGAQNSDGSWGGSDDVRPLYTSEAVVALRAFGRQRAAYFRGVTWLENHALSSLDYRGRRILALNRHGDDLSADHSALEGGVSAGSVPLLVEFGVAPELAS